MFLRDSAAVPCFCDGTASVSSFLRSGGAFEDGSSTVFLRDGTVTSFLCDGAAIALSADPFLRDGDASVPVFIGDSDAAAVALLHVLRGGASYAVAFLIVGGTDSCSSCSHI